MAKKLNNQVINLEPQAGPQTIFLSTPADIAIYGGAAGGGKTYALLLEPLRHINTRDFNGTIFRRTTKQVRLNGGIWDESAKIYSLLGAKPKETTLEWTFTSGMRVQFAHLEHETNIYDYQGAQLPFIGFDELTHFTEKMFFYMMSRNRSMTGIPGYIRATTNPDRRSWVRKFIDWWIGEDGFAIPERSGVLRWFIRDGDYLLWADTRQELIEKHGPEQLPKSVTFIPALINDNKILLSKDPSYLSNLRALPRVDREQLLNGNWNVEPTAGMFFNKGFFEVVDALPEIKTVVRAWDRAATKVVEGKSDNKDPDYTVGLKLGRDKNGIFYVMDIIRQRISPFEVERLTLNTAKQDGPKVKVKLFQDPGAAGVYEANAFSRLLAGFNIEVEKISKDKITAAKPVSAQCEAGNVKVLRAKWNDDFFKELENFPDGSHDDQCDALSSAFNCLMSENVGTFGKGFLPQNKSTANFGDLSW